MLRRTRTGASFLMFTLIGGVAIGAAPEQSRQRGAQRPDGNAPPRASTESAAKRAPDEHVNPQLARLAAFVGPWAVTETHFDVRGDVVATVKGTEEITWVLDRHAIRRVYQSRAEASHYRAIGMLTWNATRKR